jgi:hypothetical protein
VPSGPIEAATTTEATGDGDLAVAPFAPFASPSRLVPFYARSEDAATTAPDPNHTSLPPAMSLLNGTDATSV